MMYRKGIAAAFRAIALLPMLAWSQTEPTKAERECRDRNPGHDEYVRCIAKTMEPIDPTRRELYGEFYSPSNYLSCVFSGPPGNSYCDRFRLKRRPEPEQWPYAGKVAGVKWPTAPAQNVYRWYMTGSYYLHALCESEAGEFIYRKVEDVVGVYEIRPRLPRRSYEEVDRYVEEDPIGYADQEAFEPERTYVGKRAYQFFETPRLRHARYAPWAANYKDRLHPSMLADPPAGMTIVRYSRLEGRTGDDMVREFDTGPRSRFGFSWRGIKRPKDREHGIAGSELIIVDLQSNQILAVRRDFRRIVVKDAYEQPKVTNWQQCPRVGFSSTGLEFIKKVLKPQQ